MTAPETALSTLRVAVVDALRAGVAGILPAYRVHSRKPPKPAAPMIWVDPFRMTPDTVGGGAVEVAAAAGAVRAIVDGDTGPALDTAELLEAVIWQSLYPLVSMTGVEVGPVDVGGPTLYGVTATFTATLAITSICPLVLVTQTQEVSR